jgi:hypothetical protein
MPALFEGGAKEEAMYEIKVDERAHRVDIVFGGVMNDKGLEGFDEALTTSVLRARGTGSWFDILTDFSSSTLMPQEIAKDSARRAAWCVAQGLRKSAHISAGMLMKLQLDRVVDNNAKIQTFLTREEALAWLDMQATG